MATEVRDSNIQPNYEIEIRALQTIELALTGKCLLWPGGGKLFQLFDADEETRFDTHLQKVLQDRLVTKPLIFSTAAHRILKRPPHQRHETSPDDLRKEFQAPEALTDNERVVFILPGIRDLLTFDGENKLALSTTNKNALMPQATVQLLIESLTPIVEKQIAREDFPAKEKILEYLYVIANTNTNKNILPSQQVIEIAESQTLPEIHVPTRRHITEDTPVLRETSSQPVSETCIENTHPNEIIDTGGIFDDLSEYELDKEFWDIGHENEQLWEKILAEAQFTDAEIASLSGYFSEDRLVKRDEVKKLIGRLTQAVAMHAD